MTSSEKPFWKTKSLSQMTREEWESLCDNCARCCLIKLRDEYSDAVYYTDVHCHLLDTGACTCTKYETRQKYVPTCIVLSPENLSNLDWMPSTCAYRLVNEGKDLYWWHPLVSGNAETVEKAGVSIRHKTICEEDVDEDDLEDRIVGWPE